VRTFAEGGRQLVFDTPPPRRDATAISSISHLAGPPPYSRRRLDELAVTEPVEETVGQRRFVGVVPDGTHLGESQETDGTYRGLLYDDETGKLVGHIELEEEYDWDDDSSSPANEDEPDLAGALVGLAFLGVIIGAVEGAKYLHRRRQDRQEQLPQVEAETLRARARRVWKPLAPPTAEIAAAPVDDAITMSKAEWQERVRAMLLARAFSEEQQRILSHARIADADAEMLEWQRAFNSLTPQQFSDRITLMLEANPALLTEAEARFLTMFGLGTPAAAATPELQPAHRAPAAAPTPGAAVAAPAGWYDNGAGQTRWWDGYRWTAHAQAPRVAPQAAAGWYSDGAGGLRWWDGRQWTTHVHPAAGPSVR
jgi:hypothetical protein